MNKKYYYISLNRIKEASSVLNYGVFDAPIEGGHPFPDAYLYIGEHLPGTLIWDKEKEEVREATTYDLVMLKRRPLYEGEFINVDKVDSIRNYPVPEGIMKPVFNYEKVCWEDGITDIERQAILSEEYLAFYNRELINASKARVEYDASVLTSADYAEVKKYIKAINPYVSGEPEVISIVMDRPKAFLRYN